MRHTILSSLIVLALLGSATTSYAQETPSRLAVDVSGGHSAFAGGGIPIGHFTLGGGVRWSLRPKVSVGPEVVFMRGPGHDRDVFLTGKVTVDFMPGRLVSPYFVADAGTMLHAGRFVKGRYWSREGAVSAGGGARINVSPRLSIAPEVRLGWEPHMRIGVLVSWRP